MSDNPSNKKMERHDRKDAELDSDFEPDVDEDLSYNSESITTENQVYEETNAKALVGCRC